jgi:glycosyltransferase involved in cell wall biosynthesis
MKKVLIIVTKAELGGAQSFVESLARGLAGRDMDVTVGYGEDGYLAHALPAAGIRAIQLPSLRRSRNPLHSLLYARDLSRLLDGESFDAVHFNSTNALFGALGARLAKRRPTTIFTFHGLSFLDPDHATSRLMKWAYKLIFKALLRFIDEKVFVSSVNFAYAKKIGLVADGHVIYNAVSPDYLSRSEARAFLEKEAGVSLEGKFLIGSIGRLAYPKNYELFIEAASLLARSHPEAASLVIGSGPQKETYEKLIKQRGLADKFFILKGMEGASRYLKGFDLFALPSLYEGMSMTLLEAIGAGIPVLASSVGGNPEVLLGDERQLFTSGNAQDLAAKAAALIDNNSLRAACSAANGQRAKDFSLDKMVESYAKIMDTKKPSR